MYRQEGSIFAKCHCAIAYKPECAFRLYDDKESDTRHARDIDDDYKRIAETMKLFGNSAYGRTVTNKEKLCLQLMGMR